MKKSRYIHISKYKTVAYICVLWELQTECNKLNEDIVYKETKSQDVLLLKKYVFFIYIVAEHH